MGPAGKGVFLHGHEGPDQHAVSVFVVLIAVDEARQTGLPCFGWNLVPIDIR